MMTEFKHKDGPLLIDGPAGQLELLLNYPDPDKYPASKPVVVICHPHPLYGGSLTNKVVHMIGRAVNDLGLAAIRFNFRGVGKSEGSFDDGRGESDDLAAVVHWVRQQYPDSPLWLAGFSFGAYIALKAHKRVDAEKLLLVAPPVTLYDLEGVSEVAIPWWVIQGGQDEVIDPLAVDRWVKQHSTPPIYEWYEPGSHFFHGQLNYLRDFVKQAWQA